MSGGPGPGRLWWDALLQRRVLQGPWPGAAHAGLVASLAILFGGSLLVQLEAVLLAPRGAGLGRGLFWHTVQAGLDGAGLVLLASAVLLLGHNLTAGRRRPRAGQRVATLALLLALAGTGFLLGGLRASLDRGAGGGLSPIPGAIAELLLLAAADEGARAGLYLWIWWVHLGLVGAVFALLPFFALRHAALAPLHVALARPGRGVLSPPFDLRQLIAMGQFDVKVGVTFAGDLSATWRLGLLACTQCRRCDEVCPSHQSDAALRPSRLVAKLGEALSQPGEPAPLVEGWLTEAELWSCHQCGACTDACPVFLEPPALVMELRRDLAARGKLSGRQAEVLNHLAGTQNPYGLAHSRRAEVARALAPPMASADCDTAYWVGCVATYDARAQQVAAAMLELLRRAGRPVLLLGAQERCCGDPARRLGEEGRFQELALQNIEALVAAGVRRVITHCAHCFHVLGKEYPALGARFEVVHHATVLEELLASGALSPSIPVAVRAAVHDACHLGRLGGEYAAPREVLGRLPGVELIELEATREHATCCGGGGAGYWFDAPRPEHPAARRVRAAEAVGATALVSECTFCMRLLGDAASSVAAGGVEVRDLAEWVLQSLGEER